MSVELDLNSELWRGLDGEAAARVAKLFRPETFEAGEILMLQGGRSDHAVILRAGAVEVVRELPGGAEIPLGEMGAGAVIGEIGLMADAPRLATVRARTDVDALILTRAAFRGASDGLDPAALHVARNILAVLAERLTAQTGRILAEPPGPILALPRIAAADDRPAEVDFAWRDFLKILPSMAEFGPDEIAALAAAARPLALAKGAILAAAGEPIEMASFVLRGAVAGVRPDGGVVHSLNVLAPGELAGASHLLLGHPAPLAYRAKEATVLAQIPADAYRRMLAGNDELGLAVIRATAWSLSRGFRRSNNTLGNRNRLARAQAGRLAASA